MRIRADQQVALGDVRLGVFVQRLAEHLKNDFASDLAANGIAETEVEQQVRQSIVVAGEFGVEAESDLWLFGECMAIFGPYFPEGQPWAEQVLLRRDINGTEKMDEINGYMLFSLQPSR